MLAHLILTVANRRKWLALVVFLLPFTIGASFLTFLPNIYQSTATVLIERQQVPEVFVRPTVTSELETRLRTISQDILSRSRLEAIIVRFGLYADQRRNQPIEAVVARMQRDIDVDLKGIDQRRGPTFAFAVSYRGHDPQTVAQVANTLASFYVEENSKVRGRQAAGTAQFLKAQLIEARNRLQDQERRVSQFKRRNLADLPQPTEMTVGLIYRLYTQLRLNLDSQARLTERRLALGRRAEQVPIAIDAAGAGGTGLPIQPTADDIPRLRQHLRQLRTRYTDQHPDVVRVRAMIADLETQPADAAPPARDDRREPAATTRPYLTQIHQAEDD